MAAFFVAKKGTTDGSARCGGLPIDVLAWGMGNRNGLKLDLGSIDAAELISN